MKKFLKIASIVLVIAMVACFAACGKEPADNGDTTASAGKTVLTMATNAASMGPSPMDTPSMD